MKMLKKIIKFVVIGLVAVAISSIVISIFSVAREITRIPKEGVMGLEAKSYKVLGIFKLSDWSKISSDKEYITIFQGKLLGTNQTELRAYYDDGEVTKYIGKFDSNLGLESIKTLFIDINGEKCIVGWVSPNINGKLYAVHIERTERDKTKWMEAQKESTIEKNLFIIPIVGSEVNLWDHISMVSIQTKESLKRGFDGDGSYWEVEKLFDPAMDISKMYIKI